MLVSESLTGCSLAGNTVLVQDTPDRIRALRERAGLTQDELAAKLGVNRSAVCRWERGRRRRPPVEAIAEALNMTPAEFYAARIPKAA